MRLVLALVGFASWAQETKPPDKIELPTSAADLERGKKLYNGSCTYCHGPLGDGGKGANLARPALTRAKTDAELVRVIEVGIPGTEMPGAWHMTNREMTQVAAYVRTLGKVDVKPVPGDPAAGKKIYAKSGCAACHTVKENGYYLGGLQGPDLSSIGLRRSATYLRESLLDPAASLPENFVPVTVATKAGRSITGRILHEDTFALMVRDFNGANHALAKSDIKETKKDRKQSPMPPFKDKLTAEELENLIAYLVSLQEPAQ